MSMIFKLFFIFHLFLVSFIIIDATIANSGEVEDEHEFSYDEPSGNGPTRWGEKPEWKHCATGKFQSPIDLLHPWVILFQLPGSFNRYYIPAPAVLINRGHDIMVSWKENAGKINILGIDYNLVQCHWHSPAEHTLNSTRYDMELHMIHENLFGHFAVISILYKFGPPDSFLTQLYILNLLPQIASIGASQEIELGNLDPEDIEFNSTKFYGYFGSLTTPPCTEIVVWIVIKEVKTVSLEQVQALRAAVDDGYEDNARPTQEGNGRPVLLYGLWNNNV